MEAEKPKNPNHGGYRINSGRKKVEDKKIQVHIGIRESSLIKVFGSKPQAREHITNYVDNKIAKHEK